MRAQQRLVAGRTGHNDFNDPFFGVVVMPSGAKDR
jgi:hypothetical protein